MIDLLVGDCLRILSTLPVGSFDVVVTSPPYNIGIDYRAFDDCAPRAKYLLWTMEWLDAVRRVLDDRGSLFLNIGGKPTDPMVPHQVLVVATEHGWVLQNTIHWIKSFSEDDGSGRARPCEGHVKPINSPRFLNDAVEHVFHLTKKGDVEIDRLAVGVPFADESNLRRGTRGKHGNVRCRGNAWHVPYETIQSRRSDRPHPATFPPALAEMCYRLHGLERAGRTLDPFSGLGSSARAAKKLGLHHVGIELSAEDVADARRLLEEEFPDRGFDPREDPARFGAS